ncbi:MAG TPA: DUF4214 domain-containing protein [Pyrinomonadaceae bacterium]|jgi:hypothetical protein|nr:DUF4214 domain-containing protein [Pyrinomonadaceae bacterium]
MKRFIRFSLQATLFIALSASLLPSKAQAQCTFVNGTFEDGTTTGWTIYSRPSPGLIVSFYNYTGTSSPLSAHAISAPPQGTHALVSDQNGPGTQAFYQDVVVPSGPFATLSFYLAYNNTWTSFVNLNTLDYNANQQLRFDLMKTTAGLESIASTDVMAFLLRPKQGDPLILSPTIYTFDLSGFGGQTVRFRFAQAVGLFYFPAAIDNVCLSTTALNNSRPTATGSNVALNFGSVRMVYNSVAVAGTTTVQQLDSSLNSGPPVGDTFVGPTYDISTNATFVPPATICMQLPSITDQNTFAHLRMLHKVAGIWTELTQNTLNYSTKELCAISPTLSPFAVGISSGSPTNAPAQISGATTTPDGAPLAGATVTLNGGSSRKTITDGNGNYRFESVDTNNFYTVGASRVNYTFSPASRSYSVLGNVSDASFSAARDSFGANEIDSPDIFVRQHYVDFLGREPDESGFSFWSDQILSCGRDVACIERRRINVSAAYFLSIEFQQTGGLVDALYRASYNRRPMYAEFMPDAATVGRDVVVGRADWSGQLEANKEAFIAAWVERPAFRAAYDNLANDAFVDTLINHAGGFNANRAALVNGITNGTLSRPGVLRQIAENEGFVSAKSNQMFVMMEYFGYLRRDPDETGYQFWLNKLNQFDGNFEQAEMVKAFIVSGEYRDRFAR